MSFIKDLVSFKRWRQRIKKAKSSVASAGRFVWDKTKKSTAAMRMHFAKNYRYYVTGAAAATAATLISRALNRDANDTAEGLKRTYGDIGNMSESELGNYSRDNVRKLDIAVGSLVLRTGDSNSERKCLARIILAYHHLLNTWPSEDGADFAITADKMLGAVYRRGLKPEEDWDSDALMRSLLQAKDDNTPDSDVDNELMYCLYADSLRIPLMSY